MSSEFNRSRTLSATSTFSEIDTSDLPGDFSLNVGELPTFDLRDIIMDESNLSNTDYINNNVQENFIEMKSEIKIELSPEADMTPISSVIAKHEEEPGGKRYGKRIPKFKKSAVPDSSSIQSHFGCIVCKRKFSDKAEMKHHVRSQHLRLTFNCQHCNKRVFHDRLKSHIKWRCPQRKEQK